jgi:hypothetical protein
MLSIQVSAELLSFEVMYDVLLMHVTPAAVVQLSSTERKDLLKVT